MDTQYFRFIEVSPDTELYETYLAVRYEIFCAELGRVGEFTTGSGNQCLETDMFDPYSRHWLSLHRQTGQPAGCCRLILPNPEGLNVMQRYSVTDWPYPDAKPENTAEISRMAIAPEFRRRSYDRGKPVAGDPNRELPSNGAAERGRRHQPELVLGMYREIFRLSAEIGITHAYAAMAQNFIRLLLLAGFPFKSVGPINQDVDPPRRPYIISRDDTAQHLSVKNRSLMQFLHGEQVNWERQAEPNGGPKPGLV